MIREHYKNGKFAPKHNGKGTKLYDVWCNMKYRCDNQRNNAYKYYGARGIKVCSEWYDFAVFREGALNNGYGEGLTIDRIDVNRDYEPSNCRWITMSEQNKNQQRTIKVELNGHIYSFKEFCRKFKLNYCTILYQYHKNNDDRKVIDYYVNQVKEISNE